MRRKRGGRERDVDLEVRRHTKKHANNHAHTHPYARARAHALSRTHAHTHTRTHAHTQTHTHTHKTIDTQFNTHTRAHWHTHTHTHTHTNYVCAEPLESNCIGCAAGTVYKPIETLPASNAWPGPPGSGEDGARTLHAVPGCGFPEIF